MRILDRMNRPIMVAGEPVRPRASIGIAVSTTSTASTPAALLHRADVAMYRAKQRKHEGSHWALSVDQGSEPAAQSVSVGPVAAS